MTFDDEPVSLAEQRAEHDLHEQTVVGGQRDRLVRADVVPRNRMQGDVDCADQVRRPALPGAAVSRWTRPQNIELNVSIPQ
ncbi:MAG: hypothetical protein JJE50_08835 [Actinomycetales bacterium]|nr:hypothetical protein [Actinomycetales bacterium]